MMNGTGSNFSQEGRPVVVTEFEFPKTTIGRLRAFIHQLAGQWAIRYVVQQQNEINIQQKLTETYLTEGLQGVDHELMQTRKRLAELTAVIAHQQKKIGDLESRLQQKLKTEK